MPDIINLRHKFRIDENLKSLFGYKPMYKIELLYLGAYFVTITSQKKYIYTFDFRHKMNIVKIE